MTGTLIVFGEHKQEALFGRLLKEHFEGKELSDFLFHEVKNASDNLSNDGTFDANRLSQREIYDVMRNIKPNVTIDVHTGSELNHVYRAELWTYTEYDKLKPLDRPIDGFYLTGQESIRVVRIQAESAPLPVIVTQDEFPFLALEIFLDFEDHKPPYRKQVEFAANLIERLSFMYKIQASSA